MQKIRLLTGDIITISTYPRFFGRFLKENQMFIAKDKIFVRKGVKISSIPVRVLIHSAVHGRQQTKIGTFKWHLKYLFSKSFRLNSEIDAISAEIAYGVFDAEDRYEAVQRYARKLCSRKYLWAGGKPTEANVALTETLITYRIPYYLLH